MDRLFLKIPTMVASVMVSDAMNLLVDVRL